MGWWVILNPAAGRRGKLEAATAGALRAAGVDFELAVSPAPDRLPELVAAGREAGASDFAAVGGDGTAHRVLNALLAEPWDRPPTLAILPAGTGSDFIRTFGLPRTIAAMAPRLATDARYRCDVGLLEGTFGRRYFLNVADAGIAAAATKVATRMPRLVGPVRYPVGFWTTLPFFPPAPVEVVTPDRRHEADALNVVIANGQFFGGGMNVAPKAMLTDGELDIQVFSGPRRNAFAVMPRVVRGLHLGHSAVRRLSAAEFEIRCPPDWPIEADGELVGTGPLTGRVLPGAIDFKI